MLTKTQTSSINSTNKSNVIVPPAGSEKHIHLYNKQVQGFKALWSRGII